MLYSKHPCEQVLRRVGTPIVHNRDYLARLCTHRFFRSWKPGRLADIHHRSPLFPMRDMDTGEICLLDLQTEEQVLVDELVLESEERVWVDLKLVLQ